MNWLGTPAAIGAALLIVSMACVTPFTATGGSGTGAGGSGVAGTGGTSSSGGGPGCSPGACAAGAYCNPASSKCEVCTQSNRFQFGSPVPVGVMVSQAGANALYPRVDRDGKNLFLVQQVPQATFHSDQIAEAPPAMGKPPWGPAMLMTQLEGSYHDSGPLYLHDPMKLGGLAGDGIDKQGMPVLLFDSDRVSVRHVFAVPLGSNVSPAQLALPGNATRESRLAMAMDAATPRFFWISDTGGALEHLVTATAADMTATAVTIQLDTGCPVPIADTPWVTPSGGRLLFMSAHYAMSGCAIVDPAITHLYHVPVDASGQPTDQAKPIFPNDTTSTDTTPALTPDECTLLFARVEPGASAQIYAAPRD